MIRYPMASISSRLPCSEPLCADIDMYLTVPKKMNNYMLTAAIPLDSRGLVFVIKSWWFFFLRYMRKPSSSHHPPTRKKIFNLSKTKTKQPLKLGTDLFRRLRDIIGHTYRLQTDKCSVTLISKHL